METGGLWIYTNVYECSQCCAWLPRALHVNTLVMMRNVARYCAVYTTFVHWHNSLFVPSSWHCGHTPGSLRHAHRPSHSPRHATNNSICTTVSVFTIPLSRSLHNRHPAQRTSHPNTNPIPRYSHVLWSTLLPLSPFSFPLLLISPFHPFSIQHSTCN